MKNTGITRKVDELGRVVIARELREKLDIKASDALDFFIEDDAIIIKKHQAGCIFCGETENLIAYREKMVCPECAKALFENAK